MDKDMLEYKLKQVNRMIAEEKGYAEDQRYGVHLSHPMRKSLNFTLDIPALEALAEHYKKRLKYTGTGSKQDDENIRLIRGALENYQTNKLVDAAVELQIVVNRINGIIDQRFKESQK